MKMNRRTFIGSVVGVVVASGAFVGFQVNSYQSIVKNVIRTRLDYLRIAEVDLNRFAQDYEKVMHKNRAKVLMIDLAYKCSAISFCQARVRSRTDYFESYVVRYFLKSSDFFLNGMDEGKEVKYMSMDWVDPYKSPCLNPFAKLTLT